MVNLGAQEKRHAKLKKDKIKKSPSLISPVNETATALKAGIKQICKHEDNPLVGKLLRRIVACALTFFLTVSFMSTYQITHGSATEDFLGDGFDMIGYTERDAEHTIEDVMTEDGFLLKPAINSTEGDRTGFSDVFMYTVEPGDTLSTIAQSFNLKKETLMAENNLWNPNRLKTGSQLRILPVDGLSHTIKKGDTIDKIAKKYKIKKEDIVKQNQLEKTTLAVNTILIIPGAKRAAPVYKPSTKYYAKSTAPSSVANYNGTTTIGRLLWPAKGQITQGYRRGHLAIDIAHRAKGAIYASASGKVIKAATGWNGGYGNVVIIDHGNGMQTLYAHNEKLYVKSGQYVEKGQTIAWMGNTGRVYGRTGIHLHFEVRIKGVKYNPMNFF